MRFIPSIFVMVLLLGTSALAQSSQDSSSTFLFSDTLTQGNWQGKYGTDGYLIANTNLGAQPSYAVLTPENALGYTWASDTSDPRAVNLPGNSGNIASCWYNSGIFSIDINITDGNSHQIALYALDWNYGGRAETIQIVDANNPTNILSSQSISGFGGGTYLVWAVSGHVTLNVMATAGVNGVVSGIFFGSTYLATATSTGVNASAAFLGSDNATEGSWQGKYGADGYSIGDTPYSNGPRYAIGAPQNELGFIWASNTNDPRALAITGGSGGIASCWYNPVGFSWDVDIVDGNSHRIALYAVDWDSSGRSESIQIVDANNPTNVLDTEALSRFTGGVYLLWAVSGHVRINVLATAGANAVISGMFFDTLAPIIRHAVSLTWAPSPSSATSEYNVYRSNTSGNGYVKIASIAQLSYTDTTTVSGQTYFYVTTAEDLQGDESSFSNEIEADIP